MAVSYTFGTGAVVIFGGSGGLGSEICRAFAKAGCDVAFTYRTAAEAARKLRSDLEEFGVAASHHQVDIVDPAQVETLFSTVIQQHGSIQAVIYASGPHIDVAHILENTPERFRFIVEAELLGFFHIARSALPHLKKTQGNIVACVTYANGRVLPNDGQSASPKAGIESLIRQIAVEEGEFGVRANCIGLGWFDAGQGALAPSTRSNTQTEIGKEMVELMANMVPLGKRPGRAEELANTVLFFASEQASYITGQRIFVDGGATL